MTRHGSHLIAPLAFTGVQGEPAADPLHADREVLKTIRLGVDGRLAFLSVSCRIAAGRPATLPSLPLLPPSLFPATFVTEYTFSRLQILGMSLFAVARWALVGWLVVAQRYGRRGGALKSPVLICGPTAITEKFRDFS